MALIAPLHLLNARKLAELSSLCHEHGPQFGRAMNGDTGACHIVLERVVNQQCCNTQTRALEAQINLLAHVGKLVPGANHG